MNFLKTYILLFAIIILSAFLFQCTWIYPTAKKTNEKYLKNVPYEIIIVPGFPYNSEEWSKVVQMRVRWAKYLFDNNVTENIMFSGSAVYSPYIESIIMKKYAIELGVPAENIFTEQLARHSTENLYYSYIRAQELGFKKIALASDPFQTNNLRTFKQRWGIKVGLLPIIFEKISPLDVKTPIIDPSIAFVDSFVSITETETFSERINGTLGNKIRWREEDLRFKRQKKRQANRGMMIPKKKLNK